MTARHFAGGPSCESSPYGGRGHITSVLQETIRVRLCCGRWRTGAVGTIIRELLEARKFPFKKMKFVASRRSAGRRIPFAGQEIVVEELKGPVFDGVNLVISKQYVV